jgi:hypothetical protein
LLNNGLDFNARNTSRVDNVSPDGCCCPPCSPVVRSNARDSISPSSSSVFVSYTAIIKINLNDVCTAWAKRVVSVSAFWAGFSGTAGTREGLGACQLRRWAGELLSAAGSRSDQAVPGSGGRGNQTSERAGRCGSIRVSSCGGRREKLDDQSRTLRPARQRSRSIVRFSRYTVLLSLSHPSSSKR